MSHDVGHSEIAISNSCTSVFGMDIFGWLGPCLLPPLPQTLLPLLQNIAWVVGPAKSGLDHLPVHFGDSLVSSAMWCSSDVSEGKGCAAARGTAEPVQELEVSVWGKLRRHLNSSWSHHHHTATAALCGNVMKRHKPTSVLHCCGTLQKWDGEVFKGLPSPPLLHCCHGTMWKWTEEATKNLPCPLPHPFTPLWTTKWFMKLMNLMNEMKTSQTASLHKPPPYQSLFLTGQT